TDDTGVSGYYIYSGLNSATEGDGSYTFGATDAGDVLSYTMDGLTNGETYYFAITAYDEEGNESEYYSDEVEATPEQSEVGDFTSPTVTDANAVTKTLVEVQFSEDVVLPDDGASAFGLESTDGTFLEVLDAYVSDDESTVFVVTDTQTAGAEYILTASSSIEDNAGNPIVSGTSDTAIFTGSSLDEAPLDEEPVTVVTFELMDVESIETDKIRLEFSEPVVVADPDSFMIVNSETNDSVEVLYVEFDSQNPSVVYLTTDEMDAGYDYILTVDEGVLNEDGDSIVDANNAEFPFLAKTIDLADVIAPEDVTNLLASVLSETSAKLTWTASADTADDLANYLVYRSSDGVTFGDAVMVAADLTSYTASALTPGETYTFKVTAKDANGNESAGRLVTVTLPETGPELLLLGGLSLLGAGFARRRKKNLE
ncbi:fibronectin type III domain-containing protein, partial [Patescibacteria group bacterium]|nr:fibronectin type III domain-containing protein [Patescibacteria group bacterium]